jgi:RNA polymerase sigma-70 factor (ECF subfamily)
MNGPGFVRGRFRTLAPNQGTFRPRDPLIEGERHPTLEAKGVMVRAIVERAMRGEREAFAELVNATSDRMYSVATRILRDADLAEDAVQGALITAWRELPGLRDPDRFEAWVRRLVVHACYAEARRRGRWTANVRVLPVDGPAGPDEILSVHDRDALDRAFRRLTMEQRAVFVLHHHLGLALVEIAETLGVAPATARTRLHRATRALRAAVEADLRPVINQGRMA